MVRAERATHTINTGTYMYISIHFSPLISALTSSTYMYFVYTGIPSTVHFSTDWLAGRLTSW